MAGHRVVAGIALVALVLIGCGSRRSEVETGGEEVRRAVERRAETPSTSTTTSTTTTIAPADDATAADVAVWTGRTLGPETRTLDLSPETVASIYTLNGPIAFGVEHVGEGDVVVMQTACWLLAEAPGPAELDLVYRSFERWFDEELVDAGAPSEYVDAWSPSGMLDDLVALGCRSKATSPTADDLG